MDFSRVRIYEESDSWLVDGDDGWSHHATAGEALTAIKAHDRARAATGHNTTTVIEWYPKTTIGRSVVKALQS